MMDLHRTGISMPFEADHVEALLLASGADCIERGVLFEWPCEEVDGVQSHCAPEDEVASSDIENETLVRPPAKVGLIGLISQRWRLPDLRADRITSGKAT
jgi:hypothetical protein